MKYNTIIFVPHAKAKFRKLTVSSRLLAAVAAGSALVLLAALAFGWAFFFTSHRDRQYLQVVADNARLKSSSTALQARLEGLSRQLTAFETRTRRLAIVAGLAESGRTGAGGPLLSDLPWSSLDERSAKRPVLPFVSGVEMGLYGRRHVRLVPDLPRRLGDLARD